MLPESKEVLKEKQKDEGMSEGHENQPERDPDVQSWRNWRKKINNVVLDYNPKYKIISMNPYRYK